MEIFFLRKLKAIFIVIKKEMKKMKNKIPLIVSIDHSNSLLLMPDISLFKKMKSNTRKINDMIPRISDKYKFSLSFRIIYPLTFSSNFQKNNFINYV